MGNNRSVISAIGISVFDLGCRRIKGCDNCDQARRAYQTSKVRSMQLHEDIPETALRWHQQGRGAILATVTQTWGSAPRPVGSQLAISGDGEIAGSVSGGCVEGAVVAEALDLLETDGHRMLEFGVSDENAFAVGLACGGTIRILVEPVGSVLPVTLLEKIVAARADRQVVAYVANLESGSRDVVGEQDIALNPAVSARFAEGYSGYDGEEFVTLYRPPLRLAIVGAVHIAQYLVPLARQTGFDVTLIDPRTVFGGGERFKDTIVCEDWPDDALTDLGLDARTAVVTLTHDAKLDDAALRVALSSDAFYIGSLGSRRTHAQRCERLAAGGIEPEQLNRIHGPVGLSIGAKSPAEIAVSIVAEIIAVLRQTAT